MNFLMNRNVRKKNHTHTQNLQYIYKTCCPWDLNNRSTNNDKEILISKNYCQCQQLRSTSGKNKRHIERTCPPCCTWGCKVFSWTFDMSDDMPHMPEWFLQCVSRLCILSNTSFPCRFHSSLALFSLHFCLPLCLWMT